ncbi:hypothetical protein [Paraburkholderia caballeronis]|uniref:Secreted protein n=1 Tax=Paraburkholderia caballeronis TaxID=416943 RepID=A0A1H7LP18_9BURK|nr:hypothetical protein [Paraburkholderia caballeronis]PXW28535.1 hypothetical protein C7403_102429 [Paraburkholderia caballeronis]PXX03901.1 hypothetical protein C7407_102429 [Paraburkholderia caballeronis]RAK04645.1 hypothetical protein C7409_102429 [Paraburkholderia caballeronis]TDV19546.1 hypothetical protein C7408_102291 [Paraburkholderia caballeronis]TDV22146.1 hypothetical protein C7406_101291 [Paraburkholderia caballeronis]
MTNAWRTLIAGCCIAAAPLALAAGDTGGDDGAAQGGHDYPTQVRVEYVLSCMDDNGHDFVNVYKCSCVIDKMAVALPYNDFVEQSTFSKYASMGGEGGAEFRMDRARAQTKKYLALQADAYRSCGIGKQTTAAAK